MKVLLLLALFLGSPDDAETQRDALIKGLEKLDRSAVDRACTALVKLDDERAPDFFAAAFRAGLVQNAALEKERQKFIKDMKEVEVVRDKDGRVTKGDGNKWTMLRYDYDILASKIDILTGALPRIAGQMSRLKAMKGVVTLLNGAPEWYLRACCAEALGRSDAPEALPALLARVRVEAEPGVRIAIADALAPKIKGSDEIRAALLPWLESGTWGVKL